MIWQQLILHLPANRVDEVSDLLTNSGALSISLMSDKEEEIFEPPPGNTPLWQFTKILALFEQTIDLDKVIHFLEMAMHPKIALRHQVEIVEEQNWQQICQNDFQPICYKDRLWIYPSWAAAPNDTLAHVMLDPGLAFGTGAHPTTALCLNWLAEHIHAGDTVIDYGCGSGILAISAIKLGAQAVWGVDNDPQALEATQENAHRNQVELQAVLPEALPLLQCDVLIANILANPLIELAPHFAQLVSTTGTIVLSGILNHQVPPLKEAYAPWFIFNEIEENDGWVRIEGKRSA